MSRLAGAVLSLLLYAADTAGACSPDGRDSGELATWREEGFPAPGIEPLLFDLVPCLADPDPFLRDQIGYEGMSTLLRREVVNAQTRRRVMEDLLQLMQTEDLHGVARPFAVLALSEAVRSDRVDPFLNPDERATLIETAASYLRGVKDYRGFIDGEGWRHGVAHGADLVLQLILNPAVTDDQVAYLVAAVFSQVNPGPTHAYIFGEPRRLARPVLYGALRQTIDTEVWQTLFAQLEDPAPMESWEAAFASEAGLAKLHNTRLFAQAVFIAAHTSDVDQLRELAEAARKLLERLP